MNGFLLDTSVVSAFGPEKRPASRQLSDWIIQQGQAEVLFIPSIAVAEIERGIHKLQRAGGKARAESLSQWLDTLVTDFGERILAVDAAVARIAGAIEDAAVAKGRSPGLADVLIAATATAHALVLLTANGRHFQPLGIPYYNPFETLPSIS